MSPRRSGCCCTTPSARSTREQVDGVYGERTAAAVRRAKYWLGYPERQIDEIASPDLIGMLAGGVPQPPSYKAVAHPQAAPGPERRPVELGLRRGDLERR